MLNSPSWKEILNLRDRTAPDLYERDQLAQEVQNSPYAEEIRRALNELGLTALFCVKNVPQIAILEQSKYDRIKVSKVHAALWNQGLASILVVMAGDIIQVFSLAKAPGPGGDQSFENECLIKSLKAAEAVISLKDYVYSVESGRIWHENSKYFNPKERIDSVLLDNLVAAQRELVVAGLRVEEAQAILIQTMFIAYLEDRGITTAKFFKDISKGKKRKLSGVLESGDVNLLKQLFKRLKKSFNGDLFIAPCSFDDPDYRQCLSAKAMDILHRFCEGQEDMDSGQKRFWGYNFKFIPVELISAVYDRFLSHERGSQRENGAYYTPMFLVDTVVSSVWEMMDDRIKAEGTVLDPACGSGIFLVRTFQRFCEHWRQNSKTKTIRWDSLEKILERVQGRDKNGIAVRVAVFSLYIALLEEVSPPDIQKIAAKGRRLPSLWNRTLIERNFFNEEPEALQADVIVGNPPWISRRNSDSPGTIWCESRNLPVPNGEEAWAFTWKALHHLANQGTAAFLLPAMGFLHNRAVNSEEARKRFFKEAHVLRVVNFSDLRRQLFDKAINATALIIFERDETLTADEADEDYKFDYWTPKADLNLLIKGFITLSTTDKSKISLSEVRETPFVFKQRMWMRPPEAKLFNYLNSLPKLKKFVRTLRSGGEHGDNTVHPWIIGQGFQHYKDSDASLGVKKQYRSEIIADYKYLPVKEFTPLSINTDQLMPFPRSIVRRKGFEDGFIGPRVLVLRGVATASMRLQAAYVEEPVAFQDTIQVIAAPAEEHERAKFITAVLNSRLAVWYSFHGTSSFGSSRPRVNQGQLLELPMPEPERLASLKSAQSVRDELVDIIGRYRKNQQEGLLHHEEKEQFFRKIDSLTYTYFGLSDEEIILIEDAVEHIFPAVQPSAESFSDFWKIATGNERATYANQLVASLSDWFDSERKLSAHLVGSNEDFGVLRLQLHDASNANVNTYTESSNTSFSEALENISNALNHPIARNFQTVPDLRICVGESLFLIKPMQRRFWLKSTALVDADGIALDLETIITTKTRV